MNNLWRDAIVGWAMKPYPNVQTTPHTTDLYPEPIIVRWYDHENPGEPITQFPKEKIVGFFPAVPGSCVVSWLDEEDGSFTQLGYEIPGMSHRPWEELVEEAWQEKRGSKETTPAMAAQ